MRQEDNSIITLRPSIGQYFINELPLLLLCVAIQRKQQKQSAQRGIIWQSLIFCL